MVDFLKTRTTLSGNDGEYGSREGELVSGCASLLQPKKGKGKGKGKGKAAKAASAVVDGVSTDDMTREQVVHHATCNQCVCVCVCVWVILQHSPSSGLSLFNN